RPSLPRAAETCRARARARVDPARRPCRLREALSASALRRHAQARRSRLNGPEILLMDEPFSALDVQTRILMQDELLRLWSEGQASVVFVTHDLDEAIALADRVFVLTAGPATVKAVYDIDLPRPRVTSEIRYHPRFVELSRTIWQDLRDEVLVSYQRAQKAE